MLSTLSGPPSSLLRPPVLHRGPSDAPTGLDSNTIGWGRAKYRSEVLRQGGIMPPLGPERAYDCGLPLSPQGRSWNEDTEKAFPALHRAFLDFDREDSVVMAVYEDIKEKSGQQEKEREEVWNAAFVDTFSDLPRETVLR